MRTVFLATVVLMGGCSDAVLLSQMSCADIAAEAIRISEGRLVSIDNRTQTSRSPNRVTCHGSGLYDDGSIIPTRFGAFLNDDGEGLIRFDTDEYQADQQRLVEEQAMREREQAIDEMQQEMNRAVEDVRQAVQSF